MVFKPLDIYDSQLSRIGMVDAFLSSTWAENYSDKASCQLVTVETMAYASILSVGNFVGQAGKDTLWQIKSLQRKNDQLWANGFPVSYTLLNDRIREGKYDQNGAVYESLRALVSGTRPAPIIGLYTQRTGMSATNTSTFNNQTLFKIVKDLCEDAEYGFRFVFDRVARKLLFDVYEGKTTEMKFSEQYGNIENVELTVAQTNWYTTAYVGGEGNEDERTFVWAGDTECSGLDRHELFVNASDLKKESGESDSAYRARLRKRGVQELNEKNEPLEVEFDTNNEDFGVSFGLGDLVTVLIPGLGFRFRVRVTGYKETMEKNRIKRTITTGKPIVA